MRVEDDVLDRLRGRFGEKLREAETVRPLVVRIKIAREDFLDVAKFLRDELSFNHLSCISAVDWVDHFECVYHLVNYKTNAVIQVNAVMVHDDPRMPSAVSLWNSANYHEREAFDLMGIIFEGHPKLERILLPRDYAFHPLRKDFPQEVERQYISRRKLGGG